jgi:hypothetical protein
LDEQQDWIVAPVIITRDTCDAITLSNWQAQGRILDENKAEYEIHRFGHWGPGWFEIMLVNPDGEQSVVDIQAALANYPVLDEMLCSEIECEQESESWESWGRLDFIRELERADMLPEDSDGLPDHDAVDSLWHSSLEALEGWAYIEHTQEGPSFPLREVMKYLLEDCEL